MTLTPASLGGIIVGIIGPLIIFRALYLMPRYYNAALWMMVFSVCHIKKPFYQEVFFVLYRGVDRGFGVTIPDLFIIGIALFLISGRGGKKIIWYPWNSTLWIIVVIISLISLWGCPVAYYGLFTVQKFIRALVLYWVMVNGVRSRKEMYVVISAFIASMVFQGFVVLFDKYVTKAVVYRSVGSFPHPNSLAMYMNLIGPVVLSMLLSGVLPKRWNRWAILALGAGVIAVVFTKSRGALVFMAAAFMMVAGTSFLFKPTWRKSKLILTGMLAAMIFGIIVAPRIIKRFKSAPAESENTRIYFNNAAHLMADDNFFGVGINTYSWMLTEVERYYWQVYPDKWEAFEDLGDYMAAEEFRWSRHGQSRLGTCHHIYNLMAAEIGWLGMWVFIAYLALFYLRNVWLFFTSKDWYYKSMTLGMWAGLSTLHLQGMLEWVVRQTQVFFMFFIVSGLVTAAYNARRVERKHAALEKRFAEQQHSEMLAQLNGNR